MDFITAFIAMILTIVTYKYATDMKTQVWIILAIITCSLFFIIYTRTRERDFVFSPLTWRSDKEEWMGYGEFTFSRVQHAYILTNADTGYIHSKCLAWSNYKLGFDFKIANNCLGVIVRATDLSNYIMIQINYTGIRPHIRINGGWKWWEAQESGLTIDQPISKDKWYKCEIFCDKDEINIRLYDKVHCFFNRNWQIPRAI